jgi:hypothetical protein
MSEYDSEEPEEIEPITEFFDSDFDETPPDHYHGCDFCTGATWGETVLHTDDCPMVEVRVEIEAMEKGIEEQP